MTAEKKDKTDAKTNNQIDKLTSYEDLTCELIEFSKKSKTKQNRGKTQ